MMVSNKRVPNQRHVKVIDDYIAHRRRQGWGNEYKGQRYGFALKGWKLKE